MADESNVDKMLDPTDSIKLFHNTLDKFLDTARVEAAYGEPVRNGDTVIIPTAEILGLIGFGLGTGGSKDSQQQASGGMGGGGGGRTLSRPVAAIVVTPNRVRVEPIIDVTKVWMAGLTAAGFMFAMLARMSRRRAPRE